MIDAAVHVCFILDAKFFDLVLFLRKPLNYGVSGQIFLRNSREVAELLLHFFEAFVNGFAKAIHQNRDNREGDERKHRQRRADVQHHRNDEQKCHHRVGGIGDARTKNHPHGGKVVGCAGHDIAGGMILVIRLRQGEQLPEKIVAQIVLNFPRCNNNTAAHQKAENALQRGKQDDQTGKHRQFGQHKCLFQIIDGVLYHFRISHAKRVREHKKKHAGNVFVTVFFDIRQEQSNGIHKKSIGFGLFYPGNVAGQWVSFFQKSHITS